MATAAPKNRQQRRAEARSGNAEPYDADARSENLTKVDITIGGKVYHRRVKDNDISQRLLDLQEDQEIANRKGAIVEGQMGEMKEVDSDRWDELRKQRREHANEAIDAGHEVLALMLQDEDGASPPLDVVRKLEERVVVDLTERLVGGGEPLDRPTRTPDSSD
jgi:hypothetical protein